MDTNQTKFLKAQEWNVWNQESLYRLYFSSSNEKDKQLKEN